jgi:hypothetical protein
MEATGSLAVLNVGAGDIAVNFNQHDDAEAEKAIGMLKDMQARGYAILVQDADGGYTRAVEIDASRGRYILRLPEGAEPAADAVVLTCRCGCGGKVAEGKTWLRGHHNRKPHSRGKPVKVAVPVRSRHAHGVARSAGG